MPNTLSLSRNGAVGFIDWLDVFGATRSKQADSGIDGDRDEQRTDSEQATSDHPVHRRIRRGRDDVRRAMLRRVLKRAALEIGVSEL